MPSLSLRIDLPKGRIGPGKIVLLERVAALGSIAAAGRSLGMSYRRAWLLIDEANTILGRPLVSGQTGGRSGGGARLTDLGRELVSRYRAIEACAEAVAAPHLEAIGLSDVTAAED